MPQDLFFGTSLSDITVPIATSLINNPISKLNPPKNSMPRTPRYTDVQRKLRRTAHSRFCNLLNKRIGKDQEMKRALGKKDWKIFANLARQQCKPWFMKAFTEGSVLCNGLIDGGRCEYQNDGSSGGVPLHIIHCDHTTDLNNICSNSSWKQARLKQIHPKRWDAGVVGSKLLKMLFGIGTSAVVFRCSGCHSKKPHYEQSYMTSSMIAIPGSFSNPIYVE